LSVIFFYPGRITLCVFETDINPEMKPDEQAITDAVEANAISSTEAIWGRVQAAL
jgi:hypothetical protein